MMKLVYSTAILLTLSGCLFEDWTGVYYPDMHNREVSVVVDTFGSLDSCRDGMRDYEEEHRNISAKNPPDHECRLNCTFDENDVLQECEETHKNPRIQ